MAARRDGGLVGEGAEDSKRGGALGAGVLPALRTAARLAGEARVGLSAAPVVDRRRWRYRFPQNGV